MSGALVLATPLLALHLIAPTSMGFGDVKAAAALGATLGLVQPELALWTLCLASAITAAWGIARRVRHVALGPGLVVAAYIVLLVGRLGRDRGERVALTEPRVATPTITTDSPQRGFRPASRRRARVAAGAALVAVAIGGNVLVYSSSGRPRVGPPGGPRCPCR